MERLRDKLNGVIRAAFGRVPPRSDRPAFVVTARPMGLRAGIDPTSFNKLADELEADAFREQQTQRG